ncbi:hypothetical protein F7Q92_12575 [Ideonella dechloratans]|uniref:Response regulatory domain-containing protein n=1 Tax=Ideonella dechloratans TaxID=36863 RepID=A0A643FC08_IDEDE|nr:hypothetical protein [Ideonella dechloratans]KAB0580927.1 hypothetical protein F7Q92_12575 [Ideonella dechloratans]UFU08822.1 hypothetical protein LRM40_10825 [Ideonella dechloratans]
MSHILIVDPVAPRCRVVLELLATVGWEPEAVPTPWEALEVIKHKPLRLIVVNGGQHSSAGLALSYLLRTCREWAHIPVLQLGGDDDESEAREATRAGVNFHIGYDIGFEDLLLRLALMMGNEPATRAIVEASPASAFDEALTQVWQAQTELLHHPHLLPGTLHAAREVLERLLSLRRDDASVDAAMALTRVPRGGPALRQWADRHLPCPPQTLDPAFERLMGRCVSPLSWTAEPRSSPTA